ncbi:MAG: hypothetical protein Q4G00_03790 [Clostridia bacterium]|nr:hypothetical protein [Clostridia bacterium]
MNTALYVAHDSELDFNLADVADHLAFLFAQECGFRPLPWMQRKMTGFLSKGFDPALIEEAIRRTSCAPRPSWAYLNAIMNNAAAAKTYDLDEFLTASLARRSKEPSISVPVQDYKYLNTALGGDPFDY